MSKTKTPIDEMTREEYQMLRDELEHLKTVERNDISEKIRVARGFGDLSENSEYDEAKNAQAQLEARISRLEERLKSVQIVENITTDAVTIGTKVVLRAGEFDVTTEERIASCGSCSDDDSGVTVDSPVGQAIIGHVVGDVVDIKTPNGDTYQMKVIEIGK